MTRKILIMSIGEKIKDLRKSKNMTQEALAEVLNVSISAVSQWEIGKTMPDITFIPLLCNVFGVSADELLDIDVSKKKSEIQDIRAEASRYYSRGFVKEGKMLLEKGMSKFPNNFALMCDYMHVLELERRELSKENAHKISETIIWLGEKIVAECEEYDIRASAIQKLCIVYSDLGKEERAIELANKMPRSAISRESLLSLIYKGDKLRELSINNLLYTHIQTMSNDIKHNYRMDSGDWLYSPGEMVILRKKHIDFIKLLFEKEDYGFYNEALSDSYKRLALDCAESKDKEKTLYYIENAAKHAINFVEYIDCGELKYSSILFKGQIEKSSVHLDHKFNNVYHLLEYFKDKHFDFIKNDKKFIEIENQLKNYAGEWKV